MGYTHYFQQKKEISDDAWSNICKDTKVIISGLKKSKIKLTSNHPSKVMVDEVAGYINFNGVGDEEYETFAISKGFDSQFNFCKTAQNPYDLAVTATLMIVEHHAPNHFAISFLSLD